MIYINNEKTQIHLSCDNFSYVLGIQNGILLNLYYGPSLMTEGADPKAIELGYHIDAYPSGASFELTRLPFEIPSTGSGWYGESAIKATNAQGDDLTQLKFVEAQILSSMPELASLPHVHETEEEKAETLAITLKDELTGLKATLYYSILAGALIRHTVLTNEGAAPLTLTHMASASTPIVLPMSSHMDLIHLKGAWGRERQLVRTDAGQSIYRVESQRGASSHEENPFIALLDAGATEDQGKVYAMNLIYSGSFAAVSQVKENRIVHLSIGLNPETHRWQLLPGENFTAPQAVQVFSDQGLNGMSHIFHHLYREHLGKSQWIHKERPVLLNNWEATYFNFTADKILHLADEAKGLGVELLVLDDGWFGHRNNDRSSLGDWYVNKDKLPEGLAPLVNQVVGKGLQFGLWFEPEMISPDSDLYRAHADWCLHVDGRARTEGRHQLMLDLSRREVQDYIIGFMKEILSSCPISYVKWDYNRNMTEAFSCMLPKENKFETQHRYMLGLYRVLEEVTSSFPEVLFESCSGGGGRFDAGMLYYMPQTWTSDDSDAAERMKIQYGTSLVYPSSAMGAHISAVPNHQTGRVTPMKSRGEVALGGNFGLELDPGILSPEDKEMAKAMVQKVKEVRHLTANGVFDRLISPFDSNFCAWQFSSEAEVLLFYGRTLSIPNYIPRRVYLRSLDPAGIYEDENGTRYTGAVLMNAGLPMQFEQRDFDTKTMLLKKVQ